MGKITDDPVRCRRVGRIGIAGANRDPDIRAVLRAAQMGADVAAWFHAIRIDDAHRHAGEHLNRCAIGEHAEAIERAEEADFPNTDAAEAHAKACRLVVAGTDGGAVGHACSANRKHRHRIKVYAVGLAFASAESKRKTEGESGEVESAHDSSSKVKSQIGKIHPSDVTSPPAPPGS